MSFVVCGINHSVLSIIQLFDLYNSGLDTFFKILLFQTETAIQAQAQMIHG